MDTPNTPVTPEPSNQTPATPETPAAQPAASPTPVSNREQIYNKYYATETPETPTPVASPTTSGDPGTTPPAQGGQPASTPTGTDAELRALYEAQKAEIAALKGAIEKISAGGTTPTAALAATPEPTPSWLDLVRDGKVDEAEKVIASRAAALAQDTSTRNAIEAIRAENEINKFVDEVRTQNQELAPLEELVAIRARGKIEEAYKAGKVNNINDYVQVYKDAVNAVLPEARAILQQIRAAGKNEALTVKREVLSSSAVPPQPINPDRGTVEPPASPESGESTSDYLAKRRAALAAQRGMAVQQ